MVFALVACTTEEPPPPANTNQQNNQQPDNSQQNNQPNNNQQPDNNQQNNQPPVQTDIFPGKIAIVTNDVSQSEEEFRSAEALVAKYGEDKIIHRTWPANFVQEGEQMITIVQAIAENPDVRALIINQAVVGTNAAVDKLLEIRDDIFIVYCSPAETPADVAARANLLLNTNDLLRGVSIVEQAVAMGADTVAHYSFPRHMGVVMLAARRDIMRDTCARLGVNFVELPAPDPTGPDGIPGTQQFILEDVPRQVEELGPNTAFFATNCAMQIPLQTQVIATGAIYPEPCCPSPYHAFPAVLGIADKVFDGSNMVAGEDKGRQRAVGEVVAEIRAELASRGVAGRLATWPFPASMLWTNAGVEYAISWLNGDAPQGREINYDLLLNHMNAYIYDLTGLTYDVELNPYSVQGRSFQNYVLGIVESLVF